MDWVQNFFLCFIPLFVAMDAVGIAPLFLSITDGLSVQTRNELVTQATLTAFFIAVVFFLLGDIIFSFLGITTSDFRIAGGIVLVILAITDLLFPKDHERRKPGTTLAVVPIGVPLIMGPAAMTTILISTDTFGYTITIAALLVNLGLVWVIFRYSPLVLRIVGDGGAKAIAKVAALFLAAIGVMMIRVGVQQIITGA